MHVNTDLLFPLDPEDVLAHLLQVAPHWWEIGRELGIPEDVLRKTNEEKKGDILECSRLMVREWLSSPHLRPCWYFLIKALERLRMETAAEWIENDFSMPPAFRRTKDCRHLFIFSSFCFYRQPSQNSKKTS